MPDKTVHAPSLQVSLVGVPSDDWPVTYTAVLRNRP